MAKVYVLKNKLTGEEFVMTDKVLDKILKTIAREELEKILEVKEVWHD